MANKLSPMLSLKLMLSISLIGLISISIILMYPRPAQIMPWRIQIVSVIFGALCILGAVSVFFPKRCTELTSVTKLTKRNNGHLSPNRYSIILGVRLIHGHHAQIKGFARHEFQIKSKTFCAGCMGLLIGALSSVGLLLTYSFSEADLSSLALPMVRMGTLIVSVALLAPLFFSGSPIHRVLLNAAFVIGMLSILIGIDTFTMSLGIDLYTIALCVFLMINRIHISRFNHERVFAL